MSDRGQKTAVVRCAAWAWLALVVVSAGAAKPAELWRGIIAEEPCRIEIRSEAVDLRFHPGLQRSEVVVEGDPAVLAIQAHREAGSLGLEIAKRGETGRGAARIGLSTLCSVSVETGSGSVVFDDGEYGLSYSVSTATGAITVYLDPDSDTRVELATSGEITVDFSIRIDRAYHQEPSKRGWVVIGDEESPGVRRVRLTSRQGAIRVLRRAEQDLEVPSPGF